MDDLTVGELWAMLGITDYVPMTVQGFGLVALAVLFLPVWIALIRGRWLIMFSVAWKALWGIFFLSTVILAPFGISRYCKAWRLACV